MTSFVFGGVTVASFSSGGLMNCTGGDHLTGWTAESSDISDALDRRSSIGLAYEK